MSKILAAHKEGGPKAGTGMTVESLQSALDKKIIEYITKFDFNTSGAGKLMYTLVKFSVFLQSQQAPKPQNPKTPQFWVYSLQILKIAIDQIHSFINQQNLFFWLFSI